MDILDKLFRRNNLEGGFKEADELATHIRGTTREHVSGALSKKDVLGGDENVGGFLEE